MSLTHTAANEGSTPVTKTQTTHETPTQVLALTGSRWAEPAREALRNAGLYRNDGRGTGHYAATTIRAGRARVPAIRATNDDHELLGEIAKQLVIAGIEFRAMGGR